jgi:hypothetical protein
MPRAKDAPSGDTPADTDSGFAALEAKVEEMQVEAAIEAELAIEDAAAAISPAPLEAIPAAGAATPTSTPPASLAVSADQASATVRSALAADPFGPVHAMLGAMAEYTQASFRFQAETMASFAQVRGPQDLLEFQVRCTEGQQTQPQGASGPITLFDAAITACA